MTALFAIVVACVLIVWGLYCLRTEVVWIRTREPVHRDEAGEAMYLGANAFLVFSGLFAIAAFGGVSAVPVSTYLRWVFEAQGDQFSFFLRLIPGYLCTLALLSVLRPARSRRL